MKSYLFLIFFLLTQTLRSQVILNPERDHFVLSVHTIDDFIERFNNLPNEKAEDLFFKIQKPGKATERRAWLLSLFDQEKDNWDRKKIESFISDVLERKDPIMLDFEGLDWFAVLECTFYYGYLAKPLLIVMRIDHDKLSQGSKWVIHSILPDDFFADYCTDSFPKAKTENIINPMSHGTEFLGLKRALEDKENLRNYFYNLNDKNLLTFAWEIYYDNLKLKSIDRIRYIFFQVPGWFFEVKQLQRSGMNSGWLISSLERINYKSKVDVLKETIYIPEE